MTAERPWIARRLSPHMLLLLLVVLPPSVARADAARDQRWREDLTFLRGRIEAMHPKPFHAHPAAHFDSLQRAFDAGITRMTDAQATAALMYFVARLEDGHSTVVPFARDSGFARGVPVRMASFSDGVFVVATSSEHERHLGSRVVSVGGVPVDEAIERVGRHVGNDNAWARRRSAMFYLMVPKLLHALALAPNDSTVAFEVERDGKRARFTVTAEAFGMGGWMRSADGLWRDDARLARPREGEPLHLQRPERAWWWTWLPERRTVYFQFRRVEAEDQGETFTQFVRGLFAAIDSLDAEKLVIDLRHNGGGNNFLWQPVIHGLIKRDERFGPGRLFTITGPETFSAAMNGANWLEEHTATLFAGEPTAGRPNHYGDARQVRLPNSGLTAFVSTLPWSARLPQDRRPWIAPHLAIEPAFADWRANRDPVLDACLAFEGRPLLPALRAAAAEGDTAKVLATLRDWRLRWPERWGRSDEREINRLGYELLQDRRLPAAVAVMRANTVAYPRSANTWDSLAEVLLEAGDAAGAAAACRAALAIDPNLESPRAMLARIEGSAKSGH